jgi:hypothetical protein
MKTISKRKIMNAKSLLLVTIASLLLVTSPASAQTTPAAASAPKPSPAPVAEVAPRTGFPIAPALDPNTGLPVTPEIDPATGLPPEPEWIDANWKNPDRTLDDVSYDGLPLSEVVKQLREAFNNAFNVLPFPAGMSANEQDWGSLTIKLQLKHVKANEIFNAMNLIFENDRTPVRWQLKNSSLGGLPYAQLRELPKTSQWHAPGEVAATPPPPKERMVYYVGNLIGDEKSGGLTMDELTKTILNIWPTEYGNPDGVIQFHKDAQLLVVNGTGDQIAFIHQTLKALQERAADTRAKTADKAPNPTVSARYGNPAK